MAIPSSHLGLIIRKCGEILSAASNIPEIERNSSRFLIRPRNVCHITQTWRGTPLTSPFAVVELVASTTTKTGLIVRCELDSRIYPKEIKVSDDEMASINIKGDTFHPE
jgi:Rhodopirellula transposase DDE domain